MMFSFILTLLMVAFSFYGLCLFVDTLLKGFKEGKEYKELLARSEAKENEEVKENA